MVRLHLYNFYIHNTLIVHGQLGTCGTYMSTDLSRVTWAHAQSRSVKMEKEQSKRDHAEMEQQ